MAGRRFSFLQTGEDAIGSTFVRTQEAHGVSNFSRLSLTCRPMRGSGASVDRGRVEWLAVLLTALRRVTHAA